MILRCPDTIFSLLSTSGGLAPPDSLWLEVVVLFDVAILGRLGTRLGMAARPEQK